MWKVEQVFLSTTETRLVEKCFQNTHQFKPSTIRVKELGRYGNSGARLLLCVLTSGMPFVLKIHEQAKIKREHQAIKDVANFFRDVNLPAEPAYRDGKGALLYWHQGAETGKQVGESKELRDMVYDYDADAREFRYANDKIVGLLHKAWSRCEPARSRARKVQFRFEDEYIKYMRKEAAPEAISCMLGTSRDKSDFTYLGAEVSNPLLFIDNSCFKTLHQGKKGPVHGDLHANNVVVDASENVHLIDFAWAKKSRHVLVDYVLMECSLRFLLFPHHVDPTEQLEVDRVLLKQDGGQHLAQWDRDSPLANHYRRLGIVVHEIRTQAAKYLGSGRFLEYLAAQFMILFGQMSYKDYNRLMATRALGLIARELLTENFGSHGC